MKVSCKLILAFWVCLARASQSTHSSPKTFSYFTGFQSSSLLLVFQHFWIVIKQYFSEHSWMALSELLAPDDIYGGPGYTSVCVAW